MQNKDLGHKLYFANKLYSIQSIIYSIPRRLRFRFPEDKYIRVKLKLIK